ncbi:thiopeptide-type bacteriocin biosynthesis protein [Filimonas zeae]|uniref:Thiopeptide-type bacteriocin biosynthesis domain-containing protein n=1 Tax=Filimonas zeae TaxID=1737353 RepID=A0A917MQV2_9BACT|nr:lantibiotic dehydratase [Filimonas zeae]MDR6337496.1 thiopeptide-type bacteriocin biosynthesis protein [Filimonas zeae]GGH58897.1 hypothetical protein GCM10011379_05070 [Filimonas zeae]
MQEKTFKNYGRLVVRTPLYSYKSLLNNQGHAADLDQVVMSLLKDPVFLEGIYWCSPGLYHTVKTWLQTGFTAEKENKLMHTLRKYAIRAGTRPTPYGIFAGCHLAGIDAPAAPATQVRKVRIDMGLLQQLIYKLEQHPVLWQHLRYRVNPTCYLMAGEYRYTETVTEEGSTVHQLSSIQATDLLSRLVTLLTQQPLLTLSDMYGLLQEDIDYKEFCEYIRELAEAQLLVSELQPALTRNNELGYPLYVLESLAAKQVAGADSYLAVFQLIQALLNQFAALPPGTLPEADLKQLEALLHSMEIVPVQGHLFHADLYFAPPAATAWQQAHLKDLEKALEFMSRLAYTTSPAETILDRFKKRFAERYETQEVPLTELLDPECGIGFPAAEQIGNTTHNPVAEKMNLLPRKNTLPKISTGGSWLQEKLECTDAADLYKGIQLDAHTAGLPEPKADKLATQFSVMGMRLPQDKIFLQNAGGAHSNILLGRFSYINEEMSQFCHQLAAPAHEESNDIIYAEIIHVPEGRLGNIARRGQLSAYEIPLLAPGAIANEKQLPVTDLMVSIQRDEIVLRSRRYNKRVIPRLSNAHNYVNSTVTAYKFLASLQHQGRTGLELNWGTAALQKRFLPRITFKQYILHRATWFLREADIKTILLAPQPLIALRQFMQQWQVARQVCLCEGDNELFIDTGNETYLQLLLKEMRDSSTVKLTEWLYTTTPQTDNAASAPFVEQFILPLTHRQPATIAPCTGKAPAALQRVFEPGSEWLYYKIYCSAKVADEILANTLHPAMNALLDEAVTDQFFFIRYTDPHYHIRLRLHLHKTGAASHYAAAVQHLYHALQPYVQNGLVWKIQQDTYQREIERYGESQMLFTEELFFRDSQLILNCLQNPAFTEDAELRFLAGINNLHSWLNLYQLSPEARVTFCQEMADAFAKEFGADVKKQLNLQYQQWKKSIAGSWGSSGFEALFARRNQQLLTPSLPYSNISSYIHMSINRWFATDQRLMEYMVYYMCGRYYNQQVHQKHGA